MDDRGCRKAALAARAAEHFLAKGYAGTSMGDIAAACGLQKASLYHHFPSKEALFIAAIRTGLTDDAAEMRAIAGDPALDHETRVRRAMAVIYRACVHSAAGRMAPVVAETSRIVPEVARGFHDGFIEAMRQVMRDIIAAGIAGGAFRPLDPVGLSHLVFGPPVTLAIFRAMFHEIPEAEADLDVGHALETHTAMLLDLLRAAPVPRAAGPGGGAEA